MKKLIASIAMAAATFAMFAATPAHAASAIQFSATAQLGLFPAADTQSNGDLQSLSISGVTGSGQQFSATESPADQTFSYSETNCAEGSAFTDNPITLSNGGSLSFNYTRVGATAVITATYTGSDGSTANFDAIGVFQVNTTSTLAGECAGSPGSANVTVTGAGASAQDVH